MADVFQHPTVQALAWTLLHFLWQGAAIAVIAIVLMKAITRSSARYIAGTTALFAMLAAPVATFVVLNANPVLVESPSIVAAVGPALVTGNLSAAATDLASTLATPNLLVGPIVALWLAGVTFFGLRLAGGWFVARRVTRQAVKPAAAAVQHLAELVATRIGLRRAITVLESSIVSVPVLVGWLKPVIILPTAAIAALSPDQVEALIAHELAHVRRHDFLVNLLQSLVEAVLFYHPAVWWLSRRVRAERELCCDDVAVGVCDRLVYATALKDLAAMASPRLALAATDGDLLSRIRRVLGNGEVPESGSARWLPLMIVAVVIALVVPAAFVVAAPPQNSTTKKETQTQTQAQAQKTPSADVRDVEKLLRELEQRLREIKSPEDLERVRALIERQLMAGSELREVGLDRGQVEELERAKRVLERARVQGEQNRVEELERARRTLEEARVVGDRARAETMERSRREMEALHANLAEMDRGRSLEAEKVFKALEATRLQGNERQFDDLKRQLERAETLRQRGLMTESQARELQEKYEEQLRQRSRLDDEIARRYEQRMKEMEPEMLARQQEMERMMRDLAVAAPRREALERMMVNRQPVDGPVEAGDRVNVTITGEPDFPGTYPVREDGTIRIPLLGSVKVVGQTSQQVQEAVGKLLSERRLGSANQVKVTVFRTGRR